MVQPVNDGSMGGDGLAAQSHSAASDGESSSLAAEHTLRRALQPSGWQLDPHTEPNGGYCKHRALFLTLLCAEAFGPRCTSGHQGSMCSKDKATLVLRFGDVEDLRGLAIRLQMSNTFYESAGQNWFILESVHIHYNWTHEATFNATGCLRS
ncbi:hypothetical protein J4Q44_G00100090 [Coregonus suidteri]|uniref:V-type proton ATPase subunit S1 luminal domain-containing protein n=1 Tax=Coregonus suidteri TaxID=861788 RepID=A0AAN8R136_9TELE